MLCNLCKENPATVTLKVTENGKGKVIGICEKCFSEFFPQNDFLNLFNDINQGVFGKGSLFPSLLGFVEKKAGEELKCDFCKTPMSEALDEGRISCPHCYEKFKTQIVSRLETIQGSSTHRGKRPKYMPIKEIDSVSELRKKLNDAIQTENFEEAARLRDEINKLKESEGDKDGK